MYGIRSSRSCLTLCRLGLCTSGFSPLFSNSHKAIVDVTDNYSGFCTDPRSTFTKSVSSCQSATELRSFSGPAGSDASSTEEERDCIRAAVRVGKGRRFTELMRTNGRIPGYVFDLSTMSEKDHLLISMDKLQIESLCSRMGEEEFLVTVFMMEVFDGLGSQNIIHKLPVLPRRINYSNSGDICNMGFAKAFPGAKMKLDSPIHICGEEDCIGVKKGGCLVVHLKYVSLYCSAEEILSCVKIDVTMMDIGDRVCLRDLNLEVPLDSSNESSSVICEVVSYQSSSNESSSAI